MKVQVSCKKCGGPVESGFPVPDDIRCAKCSAAPLRHPDEMREQDIELLRPTLEEAEENERKADATQMEAAREYGQLVHIHYPSTR